MAVDPDIPDAHRLKGWYDASGRNDAFSTHGGLAAAAGMGGGADGRSDQTKTIGQVKEENLGMENQDYFTLKATIVYVKQESCAYAACRSEACNKKVVETGDGWHCERCDVTHDRPQYRYILSVNVNDHTGQLWLSCFDNEARVIMGVSADQLKALGDEDH